MRLKHGRRSSNKIVLLHEIFCKGSSRSRMVCYLTYLTVSKPSLVLIPGVLQRALVNLAGKRISVSEGGF